jgi:hypothetical protein
MYLRRLAFAGALSVALSGCADPHFVHDPQVGYFSRSQVPNLLKSLRCELATFIAVNNQRHTINEYRYALKDERANLDYPFFPIDPSRFGGMSLELKIQDTLGTQSGTAFDWKRTPLDAIHTKVWHVAPTLGTQNSYDMLASFLVPQDIYGLDTSDRLKSEKDQLITDPDKPYLCYKSIPRRDPAIATTPNPTNAVYVQQDLDAIAGGGGEPQFERISVNASLPLAAWLQQAGTTMTSTSLTQSDQQHNEAVIPGQLTYTFVIQTNVGLDVRNSIATSLWTGIGAEVAGGWQQTGTLTIVLNGSDAANTSGVKSGSTARKDSKQISPPIEMAVTEKYCPRPVLGGPSRAYTANCYWPPAPPKIPAVAISAPLKGKSFMTDTESSPDAKPAARPKTVRRPKAERRNLGDGRSVPAYRDFGSHGTVIYPVPLSPLGAPGF